MIGNIKQDITDYFKLKVEIPSKKLLNKIRKLKNIYFYKCD